MCQSTINTWLTCLLSTRQALLPPTNAMSAVIVAKHTSVLQLVSDQPKHNCVKATTIRLAHNLPLRPVISHALPNAWLSSASCLYK